MGSRLLLRRIRYHSCRLLRGIPYWPVWLSVGIPVFVINCINHHFSVVGRYGGIRLVALVSKDAVLFKRVTLDALAWIETHDRRRFQRIQKHLRGIVNNPTEDYASYDSCSQDCDVNFARFAPNWRELEPADYEWYLTRYSSTIVHEATHGYLRSLGFDYGPGNREQVERICHSEQIRFIKRVESEYYDYAVDMPWPFDPTLWHDSWNLGFWERRRRLWNKLRQSLREE
jgi:hypothetical protein